MSVAAQALDADMPINALVIANARRDNNTIEHAINRELKPIPNLNVTTTDSLEEAEMYARCIPHAFLHLVIADGPTIGDRFDAVARMLPEKPIIALHREDAQAYANVQDAGISLDLMIARPFPRTALTEKVFMLREKITTLPPAKLRGLFVTQATTNIFLNGHPIKGLLSIEQDLLAFLVRHPDNHEINERVLDTFARFACANGDIASAQRIFDTFSGRLEKTFPALTNGKYALERKVDGDGHTVRACRVVAQNGAPAPQFWGGS